MTPIQRQMISHVLKKFYNVAVVAATPDAELFAKFLKVYKTGEYSLPVSKPNKTTRKPVAYLGVEKRSKTSKKDKPGTILAYPDSPRTERFDWTPLYK